MLPKAHLTEIICTWHILRTAENMLAWSVQFGSYGLNSWFVKINYFCPCHAYYVNSSLCDHWMSCQLNKLHLMGTGTLKSRQWVISSHTQLSCFHRFSLLRVEFLLWLNCKISCTWKLASERHSFKKKNSLRVLSMVINLRVHFRKRVAFKSYPLLKMKTSWKHLIIIMLMYEFLWLC